jgi:SAM-dependent methyltransferase
MTMISSVLANSRERARDFVLSHLYLRDEAARKYLWNLLGELARNQVDDTTAIEILRRSWIDFLQPNGADFATFYKQRHIPERLQELLALELPCPKSLLDVGYGDGLVTTLMTEHWALNAACSWGVDLCPPPSENLPFSTLQLRSESGYSLPFPTAHFDLLLASQSLHHTPALGECLSEIARVAEPKGLFVVREHDAESPTVIHFLTFVDVFFYEVISNSSVPGGELNYRSATAWIELMRGFGFGLKRILRPARCQLYATVDMLFEKE